MAEEQNTGGPAAARCSPHQLERTKVVTAEDAVRLIRDGDTVATGGFIGSGFAEEIAAQIECSYLATGKPRDLTLIYAAGQGDTKTKGLNHMGQEGLVKRLIGGHIGLAPKLQELIRENKCYAYNFPQGVVCHLFRDIAAGKPGTLTRVGLGTFIDPRVEGGKLNDMTRKDGGDLVQVMTIEGKEYLFYKALPINVAIIRGTTADPDGNITIEKEALMLEILNIAMAAKNSGGFVIAQVERLADRRTLNARQVRIPGILVDCVVVAKPENHWQTFGEPYAPSFSGEIRVPMKSIPPLELNERKIIARRAAFEIRPNSVVNLGIGMPEGVSRVANEEGLIEYLTLTTEPGAIGGVPNGGLNFGTSINVDALVSQPEQFDFYDGGGLDLAYLGAAEIDAEGNVNVSKFGPRFVGPGGFINISQNAKKVIFLSTFTAGGLKVAVSDGRLKVEQEGKERKFVAGVQQKTYSGQYGVLTGQPVLYITERCVFKLTAEGVELAEIAPGVDLEKDILALMDFRPVMKNVKLMDSRIFRSEPMGLKDDILAVPLADRLVYQPASNTFFINFENLYIRSGEEIDSIREHVERMLKPLDRKVYAVVNYDNFNILPDLMDAYAGMVEYVMRFYEDITRYSSSNFLRMKLGDELAKRGVKPHLYRSEEEAFRALDSCRGTGKA